MHHITFVCKYRKKILEQIDEELKQIIHNIEKEEILKLIEMKTTKIIRKLKQETAIMLWKIQKEYWENNTIGKNIHNGVRDISHFLSETLAKTQPRITYGTKGEVDAYILS